MPKHLLALELGPVYQLIAAARKTRDMHYGSWMLSEIAKAAARAGALQCGQPGNEHLALIAPAPQSLQDLDDPGFAMGDEILLLVPDNTDPASVARAARLAAHNKWIELANETWRSLPAALLRDDVWRDQTGGAPDEAGEYTGEMVEVFGAWVSIDDESRGYPTFLCELRRRLFARNITRNFPPARGREGLPKSSLDGCRETVLANNAHRCGAARKVRLNRGEQLDAPGLVKRMGGGRKNFPSTARLAADPWIRGAANYEAGLHAQLIQHCNQLASPQEDRGPLLGRLMVDGNGFPRYPQFRQFPFEGAILYPSRHHEFIGENAEDANDADVIEAALGPLRSALSGLFRERGEPGAYYAVMVADGDRVGVSLRNSPHWQAHREFSARLSAFAGEVREIVTNHHGALVFAAGEDVTALLPLDLAVACANQLRLRFREIINDGHPERNATLSAGMAICHFMDSLEDGLAAAREMEALAKQGGKNAMAIRYASRGGAPIQYRRGWDCEPLGSLESWIDALRAKRLPDKVAYDLRNLARQYEPWPAATPDEISFRNGAMRADCLRVLSRKSSAVRNLLTTRINELQTPGEITSLANEIIIAGVILKSRMQSEA